MADAAACITIAFEVVFGSIFVRLMCYAHVERACLRRLNGVDEKDQIVLDLQTIQIAFSQGVFHLLVTLFKQKWSKFYDFLHYFEEEWVIKNSLWYEGASFSMSAPSTNNALESTHLVIKNQHGI